MKKKTPLKQMDAGLVQAYTNAAMSDVHQDGMSQGMDELMNLSKGMVQGLHDKANKAAEEEAKRVKEAREKSDKVAQSCLDTGGSLGTNTFDACYPAIENLQEQYDEAVKNNDKQAMAKIMQQLNEFSVNTGSLKELNQDVALAISEKDLSANITPGSREDLILTSFLDKSTPTRTANDGDGSVFEYEVEIDGEKVWVTSEEVKSIIDNNTTDHESIADIRDLVIQAGDEATSQNRGGYLEDDYDAVSTTAKMNDIIKKGSLNSLMYDDVLHNGEPFIEAIKSNPEITGMTYESLGINPSLANRPDAAGNEALLGKGSIDLNSDGKIDKEELALLNENDQAMIIDALTNPKNNFFDEERTRGIMATYFSGAVQKQYRKNKDKKRTTGEYNDL